MFDSDENYVIDDICKAINIVNERLNNKIQSFPPVTPALYDIFTGEHVTGVNEHIRVRYKFPHGVWFRGHSRSCFNLEPSLFREKVCDDLICKNRKQNCVVESRDLSYYAESSMLKHFMLRTDTNDLKINSTLDWLCLMQHHGIPTRLLDWTESILIALYFAVKEKNTCDGYIFALNAPRLNELTRIGTIRKAECSPDSVDVILRSELSNAHSLKSLLSNLRKKNLFDYVLENIADSGLRDDLIALRIDSPDDNLSDNLKKFIKELSLPVAFYPSRKNSRMAYQLSVFTIFGGKTYDKILYQNYGNSKFHEPESLFDLDKSLKNDFDYKKKRFIKCFRIPGESKLKLREQLKRVGIHDGSMFPELEYQANYIRKEWRIIEDRDGNYI